MTKDEDTAYDQLRQKQLDSVCDECDCSFPCWKGKAPCIRLPAQVKLSDTHCEE